MENSVEYDFKKLKQGSDWTCTLDFTVNGVVKSLTGYTAQMDIRDSSYPNGNLILSLTTTGSAGIVIDGAGGRITLSITAAQSALFTWETAYYDLKLVQTSTSKVSVPIYGKFTIIPRVTV